MYTNPYPAKDILCLHLKIIGTYPHHTLGLHCVEPNCPIFSPSEPGRFDSHRGQQIGDGEKRQKISV